MRVLSNSLGETKIVAERFSKSLKRPSLVGLVGDLGAGKTVFAKGIVSGLGGNSEEVSSPTFALLNVYEIGGGRVCHFDLYRLKDENELLFVGLYDMLEDPRAIVVIEWIDKFKNLRSQADYIVSISHISEGSRGIEIIP